MTTSYRVRAAALFAALLVNFALVDLVANYARPGPDQAMQLAQAAQSQTTTGAKPVTMR